ncbi:glycoside hydrolase family 128 protein [Ramaria rubella]|nr:glycoside hydrolase family 128 protein [Ramaria rubella]
MPVVTMSLVRLFLGLLIVASLVRSESKRGLDWADGANPQDMKKFNGTSVVTWAYNWSPTPVDLTTSGLEFVPMQWNGAGIQNLSAEVSNLRAKEILAFNEPDMPSQSNISPTDAAMLWQQYIQPIKQNGVRLGAPAVTNADTGRTWLEQFFAACTGCEVDFIPLHWYGDDVSLWIYHPPHCGQSSEACRQIGTFYDYIYSMNGEFALPIWVTEFASTSTDDAAVEDFMNQTITFMDTLDFVERYSWFGAFRQDGTNHYAMLDASGNLNALGEIYLS